MTLCLIGYKRGAFLTQTGISQVPPTTPIVFLFYSATLINACNLFILLSSESGFVNNMNALAFSQVIEKNYKTLQYLHEQSLELARSYGTLFATKKYINVHFTRSWTKHITKCPLTFPLFTITPSPFTCIMRFILETKFSWQLHLKYIKSKLATQTNVLKRLKASK
jgi:hypothetical protein